MLQNAMNFVGFVHPDQGKDARYDRAVRAFGAPDFVHRFWDERAAAEVMPGDIVIYTGASKCDAAQAPYPHAFDDSANV